MLPEVFEREQIRLADVVVRALPAAMSALNVSSAEERGIGLGERPQSGSVADHGRDQVLSVGVVSLPQQATAADQSCP